MPSRREKAAQRATDGSTAANIPGAPWFLVGLIAVYLLLAAAYDRLIPYESGAQAAAAIQQHTLPVNPDEAAHVANGYAYKSGKFPVFQAGNPDFEAHQPPLYYALIAPLLAPQSSAAAAQPAAAARWMSILIGTALIYFVWGAVRENFPHLPAASDTAACICLLPTNVNVCASISNDVLTNAVIAAALWQLARVVRRADDAKARIPQSIALGCLLAVGIYVKTSTLVLFPAVVVAAWLLVRQGITSVRNALIIAGVSCGTGIALGLPWLIRNALLYGDPLAQHIFNAAFSGTTATMSRMLTLVTPQAYLEWVANWSFDSFWAVFDGMRLFLPNVVYDTLALIALVQLIGAARWLRSARVTPVQAVALAAAATVAAATFLAFARFNTTFFQAQGRYLYPGLVFFGVVLATGTFGWLRQISGSAVGEEPRRYKLVPYATLAALLLLNILSLYTLYNAFPPAA